jgi:phosphate transport system protein
MSRDDSGERGDVVRGWRQHPEMKVHLHRDLERLEAHVIALSERVQDAVRTAVQSLKGGRFDLAALVIDGDAEIDRHEVEIEEECLKVLALHQPVAVDLRFITACLKIDNDLERVGDLAANIAERAADMTLLDTIPIPRELELMSEAAARMIRESLESFVRQDAELARKVLADDDEIDSFHRRIFESMIATMRAEPDRVEACLLMISVSRYLERIADHATNIAEDAYYLVKGEIIRHKARQLR